MGRFVAILITVSAVIAGQSLIAAPAPEIPLFSEALARERGPTTAPFTVTYRSRGRVLAFVGADHVFTDDNPTISAVARAFADINPSAVIVEGFPTGLGPDPAIIVESMRLRGQPGADDYANSEAGFTASMALQRHVPFIGGEPTIDEEIEGLVRKGYQRADVLFAFLLRSLAQARRSGEMAAGDSAAFSARFAPESRAFAQKTRTAAATEREFVARYRALIGVDPVSDADLAHRYDPGTDTLLHRMGADNMRLRDEHLLSTITRQLERHRRVLVVYGSSHWTTLSRALESRLGKPAIAVE